MIVTDDTAWKVAALLLQIKAIKLQPDEPFTWASGWKSPIYCDNRIALSYPKERSFIREALVKSILEKFGQPDVIAGVATAAIAQGMLVADAMELPFVYVRPSPKDHGRKNLIEGEVKQGQSIVVIEDLISTGQSSLKAVKALRDQGCNVTGMISVFTYGFKTATENFQQDNCPVYSLSNYDVLIEQALDSKYISVNDLKTLKAWRESPETWGR